MSTRVYLNVYDLIPTAPAEQQEQQPSGFAGGSGGGGATTSGNGGGGGANFLAAVGCGLHHSGVEVLGEEYTFSNDGVFQHPPLAVPPNAKFRERIEMGTYDGGSQELKRALSELEGDFAAGTYNVIKRNCNHFASALCWKLLQKPIPPHINRLADFASCLSCLLPRSLMENAPVDNGSSGSTAAGGGVAMMRMQRADGSSSSSTKAFSGSGSKLGGTSAQSGSGSSRQQSNGLFSRVFSATAASVAPSASSADNAAVAPNGDVDLNERRERARKAALNRLERQKQQQRDTKES